MKNFQKTITLQNVTVERVFASLTKEIDSWWTKQLEGKPDVEGETFTIRFGNSVFKTMRVQELIPGAKVVWAVEDSLIDIPSLTNKKEWIGTTIQWEFSQKENDVLLHLTHIGLTSAIECFEICSNGWQQFTSSLQSWLEKGEGKPHP